MSTPSAGLVSSPLWVGGPGNRRWKARTTDPRIVRRRRARRAGSGLRDGRRRAEEAGQRDAEEEDDSRGGTGLGAERPAGQQ